MLDDVTATRQATEQGVGQMIYNFETLCAGVQILVRLSLAPGTRTLTRGALAAALTTYTELGPLVGGQSARGFGHGRAEVLRAIPGQETAQEAYESYLAENQEALRAALRDGTLGTGMFGGNGLKVVS